MSPYIILFAYLHRNASFQWICTHNSVTHLSRMIPHELASNWDCHRRWISTNSLGVTLVIKKINLSKKGTTRTGGGVMTPSVSEVLVELACRELQDLRKVQHVRKMQYWRKYVFVHWLHYPSAIDTYYCMYMMHFDAFCTCWMWARSDLLNTYINLFDTSLFCFVFQVWL